MRNHTSQARLSRREMLGRAGQAAAGSALAAPLFSSAILSCATAADTPALNGEAGVDRVVVLPGRTWLRGWAGYGEPPQHSRPRRPSESPAPAPTGPEFAVQWSKESGPAGVRFGDPKSLVTTATFAMPGAYVLRLTADNGQTKATSTLNVSVETPPPAKQLDAVYTKPFQHRQPALERARQGADRQLDSALHRPDQPHRPHHRARRHRQLRRSRQSAPRRTARRSQRLRLLQRLGAPDRRGDEHRADDRSAGRPRRSSGPTRKCGRRWTTGFPKSSRAQEPDGYLQTAFTLPRIDGARQHHARPVPALGAPRRPRRLHRRLLPGIGHQSLHDDRQQGRPPLQRGEEAGRLLGTAISARRPRRPGTTAIRKWSRRWCASAAS